MPINLEPIDVSGDLEDVNSVLIVLCPVCPQFSLAMRKDSPWIEFFKSGVKTGALEDHIREIRDPLEKRGVENWCLHHAPTTSHDVPLDKRTAQTFAEACQGL